MTIISQSLTIPEGIFTEADHRDHQIAITALQDRLYLLELQQFAFALKNYLLDHRELDCFSIYTFPGMYGGDAHDLEPRDLSLFSFENGGSSWHSSHGDPSYDEFLEFLREYGHAHPTFLNNPNHDYFSFRDLHHYSDGQLLPVLMQSILGEQEFSQWESHYLNASTAPSLAKAGVKKKISSL